MTRSAPRPCRRRRSRSRRRRDAGREGGQRPEALGQFEARRQIGARRAGWQPRHAGRLHHAAHTARTKTLAAAKEALEKRGLLAAPAFLHALRLALEALPVGRAFSGVALDGDPQRRAATSRRWRICAASLWDGNCLSRSNWRCGPKLPDAGAARPRLASEIHPG